ncbi:MAG: hypothetical protein JRC60_07455 [Deltaproteobacteria bacterium]|nr:hypothetical protein [Deltaproteobacteria bacterium]
MGTEIDRLIEEQVKKWEISKERRKNKEGAHLPVITVEREPGSIVTDLVQRISQELKLDIIDARIIHEVAAVYWTTGCCILGERGSSWRMSMYTT